MAKKNPVIIETSCPHCKLETPCSVLRAFVHKWDYEIVSGTDIYRILQCNGCRQVFFYKEGYFSEDYDPVTGESIPTKKTYPPIASIEPKFNQKDICADSSSHEKLNSFIYGLYVEIITAVDSNLFILAAMGLRTLIDRLCVNFADEDRGKFEYNLKNAYEKRRLSRDQYNLAKKVLNIGHGAVHRTFAPDDYSILACLSVAESLLEAVYIYPNTLKKFEEVKLPPHTKKVKKAIAADQ